MGVTGSTHAGPFSINCLTSRRQKPATWLRAACEADLPRPQRPAAFHLVRELPLGPTGKVARGRLRELASVLS